MGGVLSAVLSKLWGKREYRVLIIGLDGAGKTTILNRLDTGVTQPTIPTIGFNVESVQIKNVNFQIWDLGGQSSIRPYWRCYYNSTDGIVFVVDSADSDRIPTARTELSSMLQEEEVKKAPLLVLANKQDLPGALQPAELSEALDLVSIKDRPWHLQHATAVSGDGLDDGFEWLVKTITISSF